MTQIPAPRVPFLNKDSEIIAREWYLYLLGLDNMLTQDQVDQSTKAIMTEDIAHAFIHKGKHYQYLDTHTLLKDGVIDHMIVTPDTDDYAHFTVGVGTITSSVLVSVFRDTVYSSPGTIEPVINRNQNFPDNNTSQLYEIPTIISDGTRISRATIGAGKNSEGGQIRDAWELVLAKNTAYTIRIAELGVAATAINLIFDWYENYCKP